MSLGGGRGGGEKGKEAWSRKGTYKSAHGPFFVSFFPFFFLFFSFLHRFCYCVNTRQFFLSFYYSLSSKFFTFFVLFSSPRKHFSDLPGLTTLPKTYLLSNSLHLSLTPSYPTTFCSLDRVHATPPIVIVTKLSFLTIHRLKYLAPPKVKYINFFILFYYVCRSVYSR